MMARVEASLALVSKGDMAGFAREVRPLQRIVEDLCKLGHSEKIIVAVRACLDKMITAKFESLSQ